MDKMILATSLRYRIEHQRSKTEEKTKTCDTCYETHFFGKDGSCGKIAVAF